MKKILSLAFASLVLVSCGKETVIKEVLVTTPPTEAPVITEAPEANKYDSYLSIVYDNSAQARSWSEEDLLKFGSVVCEAFDNGASLSAVTSLMGQYSTGRYDNELFAAIIFGAIGALCPEHQAIVQSQL